MNFDWAFGLFLIAGISDGVDGFIARQFNQISELGAYLDPIADKLLLVSAFLSCWALWDNCRSGLVVDSRVARYR
jgi:phosphatidylglycerophosphate synthase